MGPGIKQGTICVMLCKTICLHAVRVLKLDESWRLKMVGLTNLTEEASRHGNIQLTLASFSQFYGINPEARESRKS